MSTFVTCFCFSFLSVDFTRSLLPASTTIMIVLAKLQPLADVADAQRTIRVITIPGRERPIARLVFEGDHADRHSEDGVEYLYDAVTQKMVSIRFILHISSPFERGWVQSGATEYVVEFHDFAVDDCINLLLSHDDSAVQSREVMVDAIAKFLDDKTASIDVRQGCAGCIAVVSRPLLPSTFTYVRRSTVLSDYAGGGPVLTRLI